MAWIGVIMPAILTLVSYLASVRYFNRANPFSAEFCDLYLLEHMLPDGHPFEFMYKGLPRNRHFPRLFWPCMATFVCAGLTLVACVLAVVLNACGVLGNETMDTVFVLACIGSTLVANLGLMAIPTIQNRYCFKRMVNGGLGFNVREEIEKKWPGFYKNEK